MVRSKNCARSSYNLTRGEKLKVLCSTDTKKKLEPSWNLGTCSDSGQEFVLLGHLFARKVQNSMRFAKNPIIIDSPRKKFVQATPFRKKVSFVSPKKLRSGSPPTRNRAMQNSADKSHIDVVSFEHSDENSDAVLSNSQVENSEDSDSTDGCDGKIRMRGGCGDGSSSGGGGCGSGGGGCGCSSGGSRGNYDHSGQSPSSMRYQSANEGGCGCSSGRKSGFESRGNSRGLCDYGSDERSSRFSRSGGYSDANSEEMVQGSCAAKFPGGSRLTGYETCPPHSPDRCSPDPASLSPCSAVACSPPCAGRKECCPAAGQRSGPRKKSSRCKPPCTGGSQSCGGGGCCGSGCRGNCGKPGQTCLPLRPCTIPPCMPHPRSGRSPCLPPRSSPPQPSCCRMPVLLGTPSTVSGGGCGGGGSTSCR